MPRSVGAVNKKVRQDNLRELLSSQGHIQHVIDNLKKIDKLPVGDENFKNSLDKYKTINDTKLKLINKYLPDLKSTEISGGLEVKPHEDWLEMLDGK
jgi:hypothetical protein|tara:strand:- start:1351 stop:1641 length:291 start_codon:yes stop_codon:yes gene_type:complete